jgi:four helix bundle protein
MRNFKNLEVWKNGIQIVKQVYKLSQSFPAEEKFGLISQITRASVSIPSNIAEGCSRNSEIVFKRFLEIAMGSLFEVQTQLIIANELQFLKSEYVLEVNLLIEHQGRMINSLINKIKHS